MSSAADLLSRYLEQRRALAGEELILDPRVVGSIRIASAAEPQAMTRPGGTGTAKVEPRSGGRAPAGSAVAVGARTAGISHPAPTDAGLASSVEDGHTAALVQIGSNPALDALRDAALGCVACGLARSRSSVVFGEGDPSARLVVVGEAPGADEDRSGRPFVGRAGKLLDQLLASIGFPRQSVYICNVLKCRPPGNRNPLPAEVETCSPFLRRQLEIISPQAILAVGTFPAQTLLQTTEPIGRLRGTLQEYHGIPLVPTYHPAALLRNPGWIRPVWEDLQRLRAVIDGRAAVSPSS